MALLRMLLVLMLLMLLLLKRCACPVEAHTRRMARQAARVRTDTETSAGSRQIQDIGAIGSKGGYLSVRIELRARMSAQLWWEVCVLGRTRQAGKLMLVRICYVARSALEPREMRRHCGCAPCIAGWECGRDGMERNVSGLRVLTNRCIGRFKEKVGCRKDLVRFVVDEEL